MAYLLDQWIDRAAEAAPEREALRFEGQSLSYARLVERVSQTARLLGDLGVRRGDRVGIYAAKGLDAVVAMYATLRAGAAYVPIDPWLPPERLAFVLADCGIQTLFSDRTRWRALRKAPLEQTRLARLIGLEEPPGPGVTAIPWRATEAFPASRPPVRPIDLDLAYILYTSGSTGDPKGMMHTHRSGLSFVEWAVETFALRADDRLANHAPLHFDLSLFDYLGAAAVGATTVIVSEERQKTPASVAELIADERLTVWYSVPAALIQMLLRGGLDRRDLSALRLVLFGGEPFPTNLLRELVERLPQARFCHVYGVTETNVCTYYFLPRPLPPSDDPIPIGRVCSNLEGIILDDDRPAAESEAGELAIRGSGVMQGYWRRPDLNARVFWERPGADGFADRFYRTGDLVQPDSDGELRFLGRKDRQIKARGHRIELDEVQAALAAHPAIEEAAVYAAPDGEGSRRIEAAVALRTGARWDEADVCRHLRERTAAYAVPAAFHLTDRLPRTSAGKIDWQTLARRNAPATQEPQPCH